VNSKPLSKVGPLPPFLSLLLEEVEEKRGECEKKLMFLTTWGGRKGELDKMFLLGGAF
jgi:hypothetical protein